jgi:hypothetical protein
LLSPVIKLSRGSDRLNALREWISTIAGTATSRDSEVPEPAAALGQVLPQRSASPGSPWRWNRRATRRPSRCCWRATGQNESAADSLLKAFEELLTLHRLKMPLLLRKTLMPANPSESLSHPVHHSACNLRRTRGGTMLDRCLGIVLLYGDQQFKRVRGFAGIAQVNATIKAEHAKFYSGPTKKIA